MDGRISVFENLADDELTAWYGRARTAVVPLRSGAGVKLKMVEALWHGLPVVATPFGAQGLVACERVAAIESEPAGFAAAVVALLTDDALWRRRRRDQLTYAQPRFDVAAQRRSLRMALGPKVEAPVLACQDQPVMA